MPYGELTPLTDDEFERMHAGTLTPDDFPERQRRERIHAYLERLMHECPNEWQAFFDSNASAWHARMKAENGRATPYNPTGQRYKRKQLKLMAQQWAFDAMGVNYNDHAATTDELLARAEAMAELGKVYQQFGLA